MLHAPYAPLLQSITSLQDQCHHHCPPIFPAKKGRMTALRQINPPLMHPTVKQFIWHRYTINFQFKRTYPTLNVQKTTKSSYSITVLSARSLHARHASFSHQPMRTRPSQTHTPKEAGLTPKQPIARNHRSQIRFWHACVGTHCCGCYALTDSVSVCILNLCNLALSTPTFGFNTAEMSSSGSSWLPAGLTWMNPNTLFGFTKEKVQ